MPRFVHITLRSKRKDRMKASGLLLAAGRFSPLSVWRSSLRISRFVGLSHGSDESLSCSAVVVSDLSSRAAECLCECFPLNSPSRRSHLVDTKDPLSLLLPRDICEKYTSRPFSSRKSQRHSLIHELTKGLFRDILGYRILRYKIEHERKLFYGGKSNRGLCKLLMTQNICVYIYVFCFCQTLLILLL